MPDIASEDRQVWVRAFYGFNPEEAGYLGFTHETQRVSVLERMRDGDLVLIYGAVDSLTDPTLKRQALGLLEVTGELCSDVERSNESAIDWKADHSFQDRWTYGVKVRRAWRFKNRVHIRTIAPEAYINDKRFERTTKAVLLTPQERLRALSHPVFQVNVYGEPEIPIGELSVGAMGELLSPSRGIPPTFGKRTQEVEDGENCLYLMIFHGKPEALLGAIGPHVGKVLAKIGRSNDPKRRLKEVNGGFPPSGKYRWRLVSSQPFANGATAHRLEDELKARFDRQFRCEGGEFFTADENAIKREFDSLCVANLPAILAATGKAIGVK